MTRTEFFIFKLPKFVGYAFKIFLSFFLSFFLLTLQAGEPSYIEAKFNNNNLNKTINPIPQIILDFDVYHFEQAYPASQINEVLLMQIVIPTNKIVLDELKQALQNTNLFSSVNIINSGPVGNSCGDCGNIIPVFKADPPIYDPQTSLTVHYDVMKIPCAWELGYGEPNISIGLIDNFVASGNAVNGNILIHDDLPLNIMRNYGTNLNTLCNHGYAVGGLITSTKNGACIEGIASNCTLNAYGVQGGGTCGSGDPNMAFGDAIADGNRVINLSFIGKGRNYGDSMAIAEAVMPPDGSNGITFVYSAFADAHFCTANIPGVINVGQMYGSSKYEHYCRDTLFPNGDTLIIPDQNMDILASCITQWTLRSPFIFSDSCAESSGNASAGAGMVSGVCALMYSVNNCLQPPAVEEIIKETASKLPTNANDHTPPVTAKIIDAGKAVRAANGEYDPITDHRTWKYDRYLACTLYISTGASLTIDGANVFIEDDVIINVAQGAELILINGARLTNTNEYCIGGKGQWGGVRARGTLGNNSSPNLHAQVIIDDGTIEHAYRGIKADYGAYVESVNSNFINNKKSVEFIGNNTPNSSFFANTDFVVNEDLVASHFDTHVSMWAIETVTFLGCRFKNNQSSSIPYSARGHGIESCDAQYRIDEYNPPPNQPQAIGPIKSKFSGFKEGIDAGNVSSANFFSVRNSEFSENHFGILSISVDNILVENSIFTVGPRLGLPAIANDYEGIKLSGCSGYRIAENQFLECESSGGMINSFCDNLGINIIDSGVEPNYVVSNYFKGLKRGNRPYHTNRHPTLENIGLKYYCNLFEGNFVDIAVENDQVYGGDQGIGYYQGYINSKGKYVPAANCFNGSNDNIVNEVLPIIYIHEDEPCKVPFNSSGIGLQSADEDSPCDLYQIDPCPEFGPSCLEGMLSNLLNERHQKTQEYFTLLDGGNTESLIVEIQNGNAQDVINGIQNISPFLSESAALTLIDLKDIKYSEAQLVNIFLQNPELLRSSRLNKILFEESYWSSTNLNLLESSLNQNSVRSELYNEIAFWRKE